MSTDLAHISFQAPALDSNNLDVLLLRHIEKYAQLLHIRGYNIRTTSYASLQKLKTVSSNKKLQLCSDFERKIKDLEFAIEGELTEKDFYFHSLKRALDHFGYWVHDDFWKTLNKNQIVEFYGENMTQLFSSSNFFQYCGYSLLDLCLYEWFTLWERPKKILDGMHSFVANVTSDVVPKVPFNVRKHILREVYNTGNTEPFDPRATLVEFNYIGSLMRGLNPTPQGFIVTCTAEIVAEGDDALNIQFV